MARVDANINKETLEFICSQIGVSVSFLSQRTSHTEERVSAWLDITSNEYPTINQAKAIAKVLKVPFAGLYMSKEKLPVKQLPPLRNLRRFPDGLIYDDSFINLAVAELICYHDFLTAAESDMDIEASQLSLPTISGNASAVEYARLIRTFFEIKLDEQFKKTSSLCSSSKNVSKRSPKRLAPWST